MRTAALPLLLLLLSGCEALRPQPELGINPRLASRGDQRSPSHPAPGSSRCAGLISGAVRRRRCRV